MSDLPPGFGTLKTRVHNPDRILCELRRILIKNHRAVHGRSDHTEDERLWLSRVHALLKALVEEGNHVVRPRQRRYRRKIGSTLGALFLIALMATTVDGRADWVAPLKLAAPAVQRLEAHDGTRRSSCSSVVINVAAGIAVASAHCVDAGTLRKELDEAQTLTSRLDVIIDDRHATILKINRLLDLAVLKFRPGRDVRQVNLAEESPEMGAAVALLGFAFGDDDLRSQIGSVAGPVDKRSKRLLVDVVAIKGDSGGVLLAQDGTLVGLLSGRRYDGVAYLAVIVPVEVIRPFVVEYLPPATGPFVPDPAVQGRRP